jgi:signal transduction histidine kinase/CheY-like chemotaxis protein/HPt (histidine-containing phosphotransfer) domain-containing protein
MFQAPTLSAPGGATEKHAPRRALFARLAPYASVLLAILAIALIWLDAFDDIFLADDRTQLQRILVAAFLTAILLPLAFLIIRYEKGLARARDAAEAAMRARSEFLAVMSHEIRTPLNAVLGFASTLLESKLDTEQRLNATALHGAGDDLLRLLNDILDFSALDAGRIPFEDASFSPAAVVDTTVDLAKRSATAKGLALRIDIDPDLPSALRGDAGRLRQVLLNLLTNAVKFTDRGEIVVEARRLAGTAGHATVQWSVTDSGVGIAPDRIEGVFGSFAQADSSVNRRFGGQGLGLAICKRIIDQMGGRIGAESVVGRGSTFTFSVKFPIAELAIDSEASDGSAIADLKAHIMALGRPLRILLAEDNPTNQLVGKQLLREFDANVSVASNGVEAVQSAGEFSYDVILMDMQMPEMDGIEATRAIRARIGVHARVPIVALTANAYPEDVKACLDAGMNGFVAKPVRKSALAEAILRSLTGASAVRPAALNIAGHQDAAEAAIIDRTVVDEFIAQVGCDSTDEIVSVFLSETERRLSLMRGLPVGDHGTIRQEAHTLKGSSGTFGLMRLSALLRNLERGASGMAPKDYRAALDGLDDVFARSRHELNAHLQKACKNRAELAE